MRCSGNESAVEDRGEEVAGCITLFEESGEETAGFVRKIFECCCCGRAEESYGAFEFEEMRGEEERGTNRPLLCHTDSAVPGIDLDSGRIRTLIQR